MKYFIITYGCQMNWADSERIAAVLENTGYKQAPKIEDADLVVVNMCSVRQSAVDRVYGKIRNFAELKSQSSNLKTIITGCILKKDKKKFAENFDFVLNIKNLSKWPKILKGKTAEKEDEEENYSKIFPKGFNRFSAFVPIMTGCNNFCAYCIVPYTRGREISRPADEIIREIKNLVKDKAKEIWLLGQNVNSYEYNFPKLLKMINDIPGDFWIRFTSPHPKDFSDELIDAMAECEKFGQYLNLPVQAGDDQILKKMNRGYTVGQYEKLVKKIRAKIPDIALSTDVIVGFPGETKKQFENTEKLFRKIKYDMAYINKYSPRAGTAAEKMKDNVLPKEKIKRAKVLTEILKQTALESNKKYIGKTVEVIVTERKTLNMKHFFVGKTRTNKTAVFHVPCSMFHDLVGKFVKVKITDAIPWGLRGILI